MQKGPPRVERILSANKREQKCVQKCAKVCKCASVCRRTVCKAARTAFTALAAWAAPADLAARGPFLAGREMKWDGNERRSRAELAQSGAQIWLKLHFISRFVSPLASCTGRCSPHAAKPKLRPLLAHTLFPARSPHWSPHEGLSSSTSSSRRALCLATNLPLKHIATIFK